MMDKTHIIRQLKQHKLDHLLSEIYINKGKVSCCMQLPTELIVQIETLQKKIEHILLNINNIEIANVSFTLQRKESSVKTPSSIKTSLPLREDKGSDKAIAKHVIAIASGKGGVGKSSCAVNLCKALQKSGFKTGLLDLDVYGPSIPYLMQAQDLQPTCIIEHNKKIILPIKVEDIDLMSIGFFIKPQNVVAWRGHMASAFVKQMLKDVKWGELDILVVDLPPGTGDIQLTLAQYIKLSGAIIVSTPHELALLDVRRCIDLFAKLKIPILGLIENMSYFEEGHKIHYLFGKEGAVKEAQRQNIKVLAKLPLAEDNSKLFMELAQSLAL